MVVRLTEEDYAKMNDFCERGKLSKEAFWIKIVKGKPMQVAPPQIYRELILLLRETGNGLNSPKNYFDISQTSFAPVVEKAIGLLDETEEILYYELLVHMREYIEKSWKKKGRLNAN